MFNKNNWLETLKCSVSSLLALGLVVGPAFADETATLSIKSIPNVNVRMYGFIENDLINDSKQIPTFEEIDTPAVPKASTVAGQNSRTLMSIRNSRLGFDLMLPKTESGLASEAIIETDFLGNQAANTTPGTGNGSNNTAGGQSERDFYNNPAVRVRHAYLNLTYQDELNLKIGQTWSLFGWQTQFFPTEYNAQPTPAQLYRRFPQIRLTDMHKWGDWELDSSVDAAKPAQENSQITDYHAGLLLMENAFKAATDPTAGTTMVPLSLGLSGVMIPIRTDAGNATGEAVAVDAFIPIIPSKDGKDKSNTLGLTWEYSNGTGIGGLEIAGLTGGVNQVTPGNLPAANATIDSGIAGVSTSNQVELMRFQTWRTNLTYTLPNPKWTMSGGYAEDIFLNSADFAGGTNIWPRDQYYFGNVMWQPLSWLRFALEMAQLKTTYNDPNNRFAYDNRYQFTSFLIF